MKAGFTHAMIASQLQEIHSEVIGLSARSVRRYCSINNIHYLSCVSRDQLDEVIEQAVFRVSERQFLLWLPIIQLQFLQVGSSYGWRTLSGLLRSERIVAGEQRVRTTMANVTPAYVQQRRKHTYCLMNPVPYYAQYHGHKLHPDQNRKASSIWCTLPTCTKHAHTCTHTHTHTH